MYCVVTMRDILYMCYIYVSGVVICIWYYNVNIYWLYFSLMYKLGYIHFRVWKHIFEIFLRLIEEHIEILKTCLLFIVVEYINVLALRYWPDRNIMV